MEKHSKLPWQINRSNQIHQPYKLILYNGPRRIAMCYKESKDIYVDREEAEANAELIVKAVNNHDALVQALKELLFTAPWSDGENFSEAKSKARKLIEHLESNPLTK